MRNTVFFGGKNMKHFVVYVCALLTITSVCFAQNGKGASNKRPRYELHGCFFTISIDELPKPDTSKPVKSLGDELANADPFIANFLEEDDYRVSISPQISVRETDGFISSKPWSDKYKLFFSEKLNALCINPHYAGNEIIVDKLITCKEDVFGTYYVTWRVMPNGRDVYPVLIPE